MGRLPPTGIRSGRGGDIDARDKSDQTLLFGVVERCCASDVERIVSWGADPCVIADSRIDGRATLTGYALRQRSFMDAPRALPVIRPLLSRGAPVGERVPVALRSMGRMRRQLLTRGHPHIPQPEFDEAGAALGELCALLGIERRKAKRAPQVGERLSLDDSVPELRQFNDPWDLLVPGSGQSESLQGEVIRIAGRVGYEVYNNGGANWGGAHLRRHSSNISVLLPPMCARPRFSLARQGRRRLPGEPEHGPAGG